VLAWLATAVEDCPDNRAGGNGHRGTREGLEGVVFLSAPVVGRFGSGIPGIFRGEEDRQCTRAKDCGGSDSMLKETGDALCRWYCPSQYFQPETSEAKKKADNFQDHDPRYKGREQR
jgi:hypothetical protein